VDGVFENVSPRKRHRRAFAIAAAVVAAVGGALFLAQDKSTLRVRSALGASDPRFAAYLATHLNAPVTRGNRITVLQNGDEIYPAMLDAIRNARERVAFESYIFSGAISETFIQALTDAARRGLDVRVVLDAVGVALPPARLRERLEQSGAGLVWFNTLGPWTIDKTNYRTHRKLLVVDSMVAFTGGAGVADQWFGHAQDPDHWRDTQFRVEGPAAAALEAAFFENWTESGGEPPSVGELRRDASESIEPGRDAPEPGALGDAPSVTVWSNASEGINDVKLMYLYAVAAARHTIDIESPYYLPDASFQYVLDAASRRGVRIRVLTDGDVTDTRSVKSASRGKYAALLAMGGQVYEFQPTMMHAKVMVVDRVVSLFGTANFDNRSFELNDEVAIAVADPGLAASLTWAIEQDLTRSKTWTPEEWRQRPLYARATEKFWGLFAEMF
jgi:cardiolipin synthase A/B